MGLLPFRNLVLVTLPGFSLIFTFLLISSIGCKESPTDPPEEKPHGYQADIPWPSLADSPWPTTNADMQRTGRSKYIGPQQGIITAKVPAHQMQTGVVFGNDSVFYYGTSYRYGIDSTKLVAANIDGTILWRYDLWAFETTTTPLVDKNGTIYIANGYYMKIFAINPDGTLKWSYDTEREVFNRGLVLGKEGTLYASENGSTLLAIRQDGTLLWKLNNPDFGAGRRVNLAFSPDGNTLYIHGNKVGNEEISLVAVDITAKSIKWKFGDKLITSGILVNSQGNIYVLIESDSVDQRIGNLYCLNPDGSIKWKFSRSIWHSALDYIDPTIDKEGNIYFATDTLYALDYSGNLKWKLNMGPALYYSNLICDAQANIYLARYIDFNNWTINAISREGIVKWTIPITDEFGPGECPAITKNGTMVFPTWRSRKLLILK